MNIKNLYLLFSTAILALATLHMATTFRLSSSAAFKVWFFGAGMALALAGALNLLNRRYGLAAFGLRVVCIVTNFLMVCFSGVAGRATSASLAEQIVLATVLTLTLGLSVLPSAGISAESPGVK